jgi:hypothetical protein
MNKILSLLLIFCFANIFAQEDTSSAVNFDFGLTRNKNVNLWPVFKRSKTNNATEISALLYLINYQNNKTYNFKHGHFLPLFYSTKTNTYRDIRLGTTYYPTLFRYTQDDEKKGKTYSIGEIAPYIRFLQLSTSENGLEVDNNLFFFMWYNKSEKDQNTSFVTFPIVWYYKKPNSTYLTIAPIYSQGNFKNHLGELDHSYKMISPLFWKLKNQEDTSSFLIPIYYSKHGKDFNTTTIFPLLLNRKNTDTNSSLTILPLFHHSFAFKKDSLSIEKIEDLKMISPLYWSHKTKESQNRLLFPLFDAYKDSSSHHFISLLYAHGSTWYHKEYTMITPFIWNFKSKYDTTNIIGPLFIQHKNKAEKTTFLPLLLAWRKKTSSTVSYNQFPLLFTKNDTVEKVKKQSVGLLFYHKKTRESQVVRLFPLFGYKKTDKINRFISPIYINSCKHNSWDSSYTKAILPLYLKTGNKEKTFKTFFPIYWTYENANYKSFYILPFGGYGSSKKEAQSHLNVTPFFWKIKKPNKTTNLVLPFWYSSIKFEKEYTSKKDTSLPKIDTIKRKILFPILWKFKDNDEKRLTLFPLYWNFEDKYRTHKVFLPFYTKYDSKKYSSRFIEKRRTYGILAYNFHNYENYQETTYQTHKYGLFPLFLHRKKLTIEKDTITEKSNIFFPLYWNFTTEKNNTFTNQKDINKRLIIFPLFHYSKNEVDTTITLLPFYQRKKDSYSKSSLLFPFFSYMKKQSGEKELKLIPSIHWRKTTEDTVLTIVPFYHQKSTNEFKRKLVMPLYYFQKNRNNTNSTLAITPLYWSTKSEEKSNTTLIPFFFHRKNYDEKKSLTIVTPLYWRINNKGKIQHFLFPLIDYAKDSSINSTRFGVFGALFRYKSTEHEKRFSIIYPLINYTKNEEKTSFRVSPLFWMKKSNGSTYHALLPIYFYKNSFNNSYFNLCAGLFSHKKVFENEEISNRFLWSFIYQMKSNNGHAFRLGYFLYKNIETDEITEKGIFPLYSYESNSEGKKSRTYFLKCFQSNEFPIEGSSEKYKEIKVFWFIRLGSNYNYLHNKNLM